jgi:hypothetical protein
MQARKKPTNQGRKTRTTEAQDHRRGIPQGSPISPLLANLLHAPVRAGMEDAQAERSLGSRIVTCADDLVILCQKGDNGVLAEAMPDGSALASSQSVDACLAMQIFWSSERESAMALILHAKLRAINGICLGCHRLL